MVCNGCGETKRPDEMSKSGNGKTCKTCRNATNKAWRDREGVRERAAASNRRWRDRNPHMRRKQNMARYYGITPEDYAGMLDRQGGVCAVCMEVCTSGRRLAVDHDHATGKVRGLLCTRCNVLIGMGRDSAELIYRAARYLSD